MPFVAHLDPQRVEEDQRVQRVQRPSLPAADLLEHGIGHRRNQLRRDLNAVELAQMALDLPDAHAAGVHRDDLVVEARKAALVLGDQLRLERAAPIARDLQLDLARVREHRLLAVAVTVVARHAPSACSRLGLQVMVHLGVQHPLGQRLLDLGHQAFGRKHRLRINVLQQLVHDLVLDRHTSLLGKYGPITQNSGQSRRGRTCSTTSSGSTIHECVVEWPGKIGSSQP